MQINKHRHSKVLLLKVAQVLGSHSLQVSRKEREVATIFPDTDNLEGKVYTCYLKSSRLETLLRRQQNSLTCFDR